MSLRKLSLGATLTAAFAAVLTMGPARAADLDPALEDPVQSFSALPVSNVAFGSGWYVRGDFGGVQLYQANPQYQGVLGLNPAKSFYSNAPAVTLTRSHDFGYLADLGAGYSFTSWLRFDVTFDTHQPIHSSAYGKPFPCVNGFTPLGTPTYGTCNGVYQARLQNYDGLVNAYFDLGTWYRVTPYVGGGVGLAFGHYQTASNYFQANGAAYGGKITNPATGQSYSINFDRTASGTYYNVAYALMAGFAVDVFDHTKLDIGYRYLSLGRLLGTTLDTHELRAGLRYMIDN